MHACVCVPPPPPPPHLPVHKYIDDVYTIHTHPHNGALCDTLFSLIDNVCMIAMTLKKDTFTCF